MYLLIQRSRTVLIRWPRGWYMWESTAEDIKLFCHVPLWTFRKKQSDCKMIPLFCALLIRGFWQNRGLLFIRKCQLYKPKSFSDTVLFSVRLWLRKRSICIAYLINSTLFRNSLFVFFLGYTESSEEVFVLLFIVLSGMNAYSIKCKHVEYCGYVKSEHEIEHVTLEPL